MSIGQAKVGYSGKVKPALSISSGNVTVGGLSGASFSYIDLYPNPNLQNTSIVFNAYDTYGGELELYNYGSGTISEVTHMLQASQAGWNSTWQLYFSGGTGIGGSDLWSVNADGSHLTFLPSESGQVVLFPKVSPDGAHIAGLDSNGDVVVETISGASPTVVVPVSVGPENSAWLNNSTLIVSAINGGAEHLLWTVPSTGGSLTLWAGSADANCYDPAVSPDGTLVAYSEYVGSTQSNLVVSDAAGGANVLTNQSGVSDLSPSFSPDNRYIVFKRLSGGDDNGVSGIYQVDLSGDAATPVAIEEPGSTAQYQRPSWSPFEKYQRFIGSGGTFGTYSSGFLSSQLGSGFSAFVSFVANTPADATIVSPSQGGYGSPLVFTLGADSITRIIYTNGYYLQIP